MAKREFGKAQYKAVRNGDLVRIFATGVAPGLNVKTDIEQLPFLINPPMFGFYFISPDIVLPVLRPFTYEEDVTFTQKFSVIPICDADGRHDVNIEDARISVASLTIPALTESGYCVFSWIAKDVLKIAKCNAILPTVYSRVFGPATFGECEQYVKSNGGI